MTEVGRSFRRWGLAGLAASVVVSQSLTVALDSSTICEGAIVLAAILTFLALTTVTKQLVGAEKLIYYHHEIAVVAVSAGLAAVLGAPVLPHLDATVAGLGAFLAFGRIGCLRVGCCHGRPARRGVRYGPEHVAAGVPRYLQAVSLIPVQAFESAGVAILVAAAAATAVSGAAPGTAAMTYLSGYAILRFALEELRGDTVRRYWRGLSEGAVDVAGGRRARARASAASVLPSAWLGWLAVAVLAAEAGLVALRRARTDSPLEPRRLRELERVARAIAEVPPAGVRDRLQCGKPPAGCGSAPTMWGPSVT